MVTRRIFLAGLTGLVVTAPSRAPAQQSEIFVNPGSGVAINGYDPVAYFTERAPVEGRAEFAADWKGVPWHFASADNRATFLSDPEKYAPQYGGWCAFAMASDYFASTVPEAWSVRDGKLYLNLSTGVRAQWLGDADNLIARADGHWTGKF